jgi:Fe-S cluster biogenesis protein NfuA
VNDLAVQVTAVLVRSILPSVIARGGTVRVAAVHGGVVTLEADGSPGAVLPVLSRIEAQLRAAVPDVTTVRLVTADTAPPSPPQAADLGRAAQRILDTEVNPAIAAHRGRIAVDSAGSGWVRIRLEGGCQGCSLAEVTIRQGVEPLLRARLPGLIGVADITDHEAGTDPFFSPEKR